MSNIRLLALMLLLVLAGCVDGQSGKVFFCNPVTMKCTK